MQNYHLKFIHLCIRIKVQVLIFYFLSSFFSPLHAQSTDTWQLLFQPRQRTIKYISTFNDQIFIGTGDGIFVSTDEGENWKDFGSEQLFKDEGGTSVVNWISIDENKNKIYIATSFGAFYSSLDKPSWRKLFESTKTESNEVNSLTLDNDNIYVSTNVGVWLCNSNRNICKRLNSGLEADNIFGNFRVLYVTKHKNNLYAATSSGIFLLRENSTTWENISSGIQRLSDGLINARHIYIDKEGNIYLACKTGIYFTSDEGKNWKEISYGIGRNEEGWQEAYYLTEYSGVIYLTTTSGIYYQKNNKWNNFSNGIRTKDSSKKVYSLAKLDDNYYAATDEGLFIYKANENKISGAESSEVTEPLILKGKIETEFTNLEEIEPSVIEVQKQALKFASLPSNGDYKRYRLQARLRNLVPRVGVDLNTTGTSTDYYQLQKGISANTSLNNTFDSDKTTRVQSDGRSFKQLSVLWNTNEFIYDDEIKDILSQARLTANIRENLLDDVTRIYYQRRKYQLENLLNPPTDISRKLSNHLEIAELTGQLDSRTGGWFSKEIERRKLKMVNKHANN